VTERVETALRELIADGMKPGDQLPSERDLVQQLALAGRPSGPCCRS